MALITVDLESRTVRAGDGVDAIEDSFDIDDYTRWRLLEGLDDIGITLGHDDDIAAFETTRPSFKPETITKTFDHFASCSSENIARPLIDHASRTDPRRDRH